MKYFGLIALVCVFQSFDFSLACNGHDVELLDYENGLDNNMKFEQGAKYEVTSDCRVFASINYNPIDAIHSTCLLQNTSYNSETISYKLKTNYGDLLTVRNKDICQFMSECGIVGTECPALPGRATFKLEGDVNYSTYGPLLEVFAGPVTLLIKICYDEDEIHPDIFAVRAIIKKKNFV